MSDIDKRWIKNGNRLSKEYIDGVEKFMDFAFSNMPLDVNEILCPCRECLCRYYKDRRTVQTHCLIVGLDKEYKTWNSHGEHNCASSSQYQSVRDNETVGVHSDVHDSMRKMLAEGFGMPSTSEQQPVETVVQTDEATTKFLKLLKEAETELWEGCNEFTALSFLVELMHLKAISKWSNNSFTELLKVLKRAMPKSTRLPTSFNKAYKITADLGFSYKTWEACINHCMLFQNETEKLDKCDICGESRYKKVECDKGESGSKMNQVAVKKMLYFPLKPILQRLFWSSKTALLMRWHSENRIDDGVLRHPADSHAWKSFDDKFPTFASDARNVRLGLASDGFNPFRNMSSSYSTWPVVLIPYNLPPCLCMKQTNFILSILTQGPKGPGDKIDVYLQPFVEELKELWEEGVQTYDAFKNEMFTLRASLMWTINDFPAYGNLSGWSTKGEYACPTFDKRPQAKWLKNSGKWSYIGHRRSLDRNNNFRKDKRSFDGGQEFRTQPKRLTGEELLKQVEDIETIYKVQDIHRKRKREDQEKHQAKLMKVKVPKTPHNWKKKSIFHELPYWQYNLLCHILDVMHIEKNICDNVLCTILNTSKSKDNLKFRLDLKDMNIRKPLHPQPLGSRKCMLPPAQFTMDKKQKELFLKVLKHFRVPNGYSSNISRCVHLNDRTIWGLKSHDCHILLQQLIPIAARKALPSKVVEALIELANFFRQLCSKTSTTADLEVIQKRIPVILCQLEKIFPPSFFDVMEHLPVHLAQEALLTGAVNFRWMCAIERYLLCLKLYVRNRTHPEGSIANAYIAEECMTFCARYLEDQITNNQPERCKNKGNEIGHCHGKRTDFTLDYITRTQAHRYILFNTAAVKPYLEMHVQHLRRTMPRTQAHRLQMEHNEKFHSWFKNYVCTTSDALSEEIKLLALGPHMDAVRFKSYKVNGYFFRIKKVDLRRQSQNRGVMLSAIVTSFASRKDNNPVVGDMNFYGELVDIVEIQYSNQMKFVLFKCDWVDNRNGLVRDPFQFTLVNFKHKLYKENRPIDEPFILASQAEQVWYVEDPIETDWKVVVRVSARDTFDIYSDEKSLNPTSIPQIMPFSTQEFDDSLDKDVCWVREGIDAMEVDIADGENDTDIDNEN